MGRASRASNGLECLGVYRGREKCQRARDKSGLPVLVNQKCKTCGEQRCKAHCKCHRNKTVNCKGKSGPRGVSAVATPSVSPPPPAARPVLAPVGRAPAPFCALVETGAWYRDFCNLVENATEVELASYMYDNTAVQGALLKRLRSRTAFCLNVYVDTEKFASGGPVLQKARLRELRSAGASVYLCKGVARRGSFHCKGAVVDRRLLFSGGANFTRQSDDNDEYCYKMTGPVVRQVLERMSAQRESGTLWKVL